MKLTDAPITLTTNGRARRLGAPRPAAPFLLRVLRWVVAVLRWVVG